MTDSETSAYPEYSDSDSDNGDNGDIENDISERKYPTEEERDNVYNIIKLHLINEGINIDKLYCDIYSFNDKQMHIWIPIICYETDNDSDFFDILDKDPNIEKIMLEKNVELHIRN